MKKLGLICLTLVLALGALGIGYAAWTDTITISGTVNTGSVDLKIVELSSTLVYKDTTAPNEIVIVSQKENKRDLGGGIGWHIVNVPAIPPPPAFLVASAMTTSPADDTIVVTFSNAFPLGQALRADFLLHYEGSIPVKVDAEITGCTDNTDDQVADCVLLAPYAQVHFYWSDANGTQGAEIFDVVQMHYCDYVLCIMTLDIPQDPTLMSLSCSFTAEITAIQWNEYGY